jgi:hypothetical protein
MTFRRTIHFGRIRGCVKEERGVQATLINISVYVSARI